MTPPRSDGADDEQAALSETLDALDLASTARQRQQLLDFVGVLMRWNAVHNLTAVRRRAAVLVQHVADCLATISPIRRSLADASRDGRRPSVLDVGSGGGLPGLVIATMLPEVDVTCLDAVGKKTAFVRQAALELQLPNLVAVQARVEQHVGPLHDLITFRAVSTLERLVALSAHLLRPTGQWMAMKAKRPDEELVALHSHPSITFHVEQLDVPGLDAERCLVWLRHG